MRAGAKAVRLERNIGFTALSPEVSRRRFVPSGVEGRREGRYRLQAGDCASVYLDAPELVPRRVEVEMLTEELEGRRHRARVVRFYGAATTLGGLAVGDELEVETAHFVEMWSAQEEAAEAAGKG